MFCSFLIAILVTNCIIFSDQYAPAIVTPTSTRMFYIRVVNNVVCIISSKLFPNGYLYRIINNQ